MRITEGLFKMNSLETLSSAQEELITNQNRLTSGKEVYKPSDDPLRFVRAERMRALLRGRKQDLRNIDDAKRFLETNEAAVRDVTGMLQRVRTLLLEAGNETLTTGDTSLLADELAQQLEALVQFANASSVTGKVFGGAETDTNPFEVVRDANGNITDVIYRGDRTAVEREVSEGSKVVVNYVGSKVFQIDPDAVSSAFSVRYAGETLANEGFPAGETTGFFEVQGHRIYFDSTQDSFLDLADRINRLAPEVKASVTGTLTGQATVADPNAALGATAGTVTINGTDITISAGASLNDVVNAFNSVSDTTGVTASVQSVPGGFALKLNGGVEIDDTAPGASNALRLLGVTNSGSPPANLLSRNPLQYNLRIETREPDQIYIRDLASGEFLRRMGMTDGTSNMPANIPAAREADTSVFDSLIQAVSDLRAGRFREARTDRLGEVDRALEHFNDLIGEIGGSVQRLEKESARTEGMIDQAKKVISVNEDLDIAEAVSDLQRLQMKLQTALGAAQNVPLPNLSQLL
ncbi:MAG: flagellar hook-associated protein 3 [Candidatus Hydrogenedentota bacterium]|nr:MAG: flagellar hook-associated protein 3 [Candidatus Hydrogenedentota bacterium]